VVSTGQPINETIRAAAIADYRASGESLLIVSRRHGVSKTALASWVNPKSRQYRPTSEELAYVGTAGFDPRAWEVRGGVHYPLFPERRSA
jgi:transposase-like protein